MPGNSQGIVVSIQAKIEGWQNQIKAIQDALKNIKAGTGISKDLTKDLKQVETLVNNLGKNINQRLTSDSQITGFTDKLREVDEIFAHMGQRMTSISFADMDPSYITNNFKDLLTAIEQANDALSSGMTNSFQNAIAESINLQKAFDKLGIDPSKMGAEELKKLLETKSSDLEKALIKANNELKNLQHNAAEARKIMSDMESAKILEISDTKATAKNLIGDTTKLGHTEIDPAKLQEFATQIDNILVNGGVRLEQKLKEKREQVDQAIKQLINAQTVEEARQKLQEIEDIFASVRAKSEFTIKVDKIKDEELTSWIPDPIAVQNKLSQIQAVLNDYKIDPKVLKNINMEDLIKSGNFDKLADEIDKALKKAQVAAEKDVEKIRATVQKLETAEHNKLGEINSTSATKYNIDQGLSQWDGMIQKIQQENAALREEVEKLKAQLAERAIANVKALGGKTAASGAQGIQDSTNAAKAYEAQLGRVKSAEQALGKLQGVVQRWFSIYAVIRMVNNAIHSMINTIKELDKTITNIAIVTDMSQDDLWKQMPKYTQMARDYASSIAGVYEVSQLYYQQGLEMAEVMSLTEATLKMARISGLGYADATDYMTNAVRSFKMEMSEATTVVDVYSAVAASSATSVTELATAMSKTASSAEAVGSSFQNTTAMMAVMIEATRESPENIGSALKSIISRYGELKQNMTGTDSEGEEYSLNKVDTALQSIGISIHDVNGEFRDFDDVIMELAGKWDIVDKNTQRYIATVMAGNRQQSRFLALVSSGDRLRELADEAANSEDASQLQFLKSLDSIDSKVQQLQTSIQALYTNSGLEQTYKGILDFANRVVTSLDNISDSQGLAGVGAKIASVFTTLATLVTNLFTTIKLKFSVMQAQMTANAKLAVNERVIAEQTAASETAATEQERVNAHARAEAAMTETTRLENEKRIAEAMKASNWKRNTGMIAATAGLTLATAAAGMDLNTQRQEKAWLTGIGSALSGIGTGFMMGGWVGAFVGTLTSLPGIIEAIGMSSESVSEKLTRLKSNVTEAQNKAIISKDELKNLTQYEEKLKELASKQYDSNADRQAYLDLSNEIANKYPELISYIDEEGNKIVELGEAYANLKQQKQDAYNADAISASVARVRAASDAHYRLSEAGVSVPERQKDWLSETGDFLGYLGNDLVNLIRGNINNNGSANLFSQSGSAFDFIASNLANAGFSASMTNAHKAGYGQGSYWDTMAAVFGKNKVLNLKGSNISSALKAGGLNVDDQMINTIINQPNVSAQMGKLVDVLMEQNASKSEINKALSTLYGEETKINDDLYNYRLQVLSSEKATRGAQKLIEAENKNLYSVTIAQDKYDITSNLENQFLQYDFQNQWNSISEGLNDDQIASAWEAFALNAEENIDLAITSYTAMIDSITDTATLQQLDSMFKNTSSYTATEWKSMAETALANGNEELSKFLQDYYDDNIKTASDNFIRSYKNLSARYDVNIDSRFDEIAINVGREYLSNIIAQYEEIFKNKNLSNDQKQVLVNSLENAYLATSNIKDIDKRNQVLSTLNTADLTTQTGIYQAIDIINKMKLGEYGDSIAAELQTLASHISINLVTEFTSFSDTVVKGMSDFEKAISNATKGMDLKAATEMAEKMGRSITDFTYRDGKYFYEGLDDIEAAYLPQNEEALRALKTRLDNTKSNIKELSLETPNILNMEEIEFINPEMLNDDAYLDAWSNEFEKLGYSINDVLNYVLGNFDESLVDTEGWEQIKALSKTNFVEISEKISSDIDQLVWTYDNKEDIFSIIDSSEFEEPEGLNKETLKSYIGQYMDRTEEDLNLSFSDWLIKYLDQLYEENKTAIDNYTKDQKARTYLSNGNIEAFLQTTGAYKTASDYYFGGNTLEQAQQEADLANQQLISTISSGDITNLPAELQQYAKLVYDTYNKISSNIFSTVISALEKGSDAALEVNTLNADKLIESGIVKSEDIYDENGVLKTSMVIIPYEDIKNMTDEEFNQFLNATTTSYEERVKAIGTRMAKDRPDIKTSSEKVNDDLKKISYDEITSMWHDMGLLDKDNVSQERINQLMEEWGLRYDAYGNIIGDTTLIDKELENLLSQYENETISKEDYLKQKYKLEQLKEDIVSEADQAKGKALSDIIDNYTSVSSEQFSDLMSAFTDLTDEQRTVLESTFTLNSDGTRTFDITKFKQLVANGIIPLSLGVNHIIEKSLEKQIDDARSALTNATQLVTSGTTSQVEIQKWIDTVTQLDILESAGVEDVFEYDELLDAWTLKPEILYEYAQKQAEALGLQGEALTKFVEAQTLKPLAAAVDISSYLKSSNQEGQAADTLRKQLRDWATQHWHGIEPDDTTLNGWINTIKTGGQAAVDLALEIATDAGKELSTDEMQQIYAPLVQKYVNLANEIPNLVVGQYIGKGDLRSILEEAGIVDKSTGLVKQVTDMTEAYLAIYHSMSEAAGNTTADLNSIYAKYLTAEDQKNIDLLDALQNASGMTYDALGSLLAKYNVELETFINDQNGKSIERTKFGQIRILDFNDFMSAIPGFESDMNNPEMMKAYSDWVDARIEWENAEKQRMDDAVKEIKSLGDAKAGDKLNVSHLEAELGDSLAIVALSYRAELKDGLLTLTDKTDIPGLMSALADEAEKQGKLIPEQIAELADAVRDLLAQITSLIQGGIKGTLSHVDAQQLQSWADLHRLGELDFIETADGLQLANKSAKELYYVMDQLDSIQGSVVFETLKDNLIETDERFRSATSNAAYIRDIMSEGLTSDQQNVLQNLNGNVDLFNRPVLQNIDGSITTLYSATEDSRNYESEIPWVMNITPVTPSGKELTDTELQNYIEELVEESSGNMDEMIKLDKSKLGLIIEGENTEIEQQEEILDAYDKRAKKLHEISDAIENNKQKSAEELALAQKIAEARGLSQDNSFKFMDQAIPDAQNNPLNYWENWGKAYKAMNEAGKTGTMDYSAFYNLVTEMGNLAQMTGKAIPLGKQTVSNAETAAALIEQAAGALQIQADGSVKIDLSKIGVDFVSGADKMNANIEDGIHQVAQSQIEMLNSLIGLLETIVTMEDAFKQFNVDSDMDMTLDLDEIFKIETHDDGSKEIIGFADNWQDALNYLRDRLDPTKLDTYSEDFARGAESIKFAINGMQISLADLINADFEHLSDYGFDKDNLNVYQSIMQGVYDAILSEDFTETNVKDLIMQKLQDNLGDSGEITFDMGNYTFIGSGGMQFSIDWDSDNTKAALEQFDGTLEQKQKELTEAFQARGKNEANPIQYQATLIADGTIKIEDGEGKLKIEGKEYTYDANNPERFTGLFGAAELDKLGAKEIKWQNDSPLAATGTLKMGKRNVTVKATDQGKITYTSEDGTKYDSPSALVEGEIDKAWKAKMDEKGITDDQSDEAQNIKKEVKYDVEVQYGISTFALNSQSYQGLNEQIQKDLEEALKSGNQAQIDAVIDANLELAELKGLSSSEIEEKLGLKELSIKFVGDTTEATTALENLKTITEDLTKESLQVKVEADSSISKTATALKTVQNKEEDIENKNPITIKIEEDHANAETKNNLDGLYESQVNVDNKKAIEISVSAPEASAVEDALNAVAAAVNNIPTSKTIDVSINVSGSVPNLGGETSGGGGAGGGTGGWTALEQATGNIGLARARGTLMGELGPELVVSHGRYFVVGQNGPEMIDLADDAIVFNHLQTKSLLEKGMSKTRGQAVTNERNAVSFATGSMQGPAMASARAVLAQLKQLRAMWQSLAGSSAKDLAGLGGSGGGGGGGNKSGIDKAFVKDLELWYNWLQRIAVLEEKINYEEAKRSKISSSFAPNGEEYYKSQKKSLDLLMEEAAIHANLAESQQKYFNQRRATMNANSNPFSKLYTFDEYGQLKYNNPNFEDFMKMVGRDSETGKANMTAKQQYNRILELNPAFAKYMDYDNSGNAIDKSQENWEEQAVQAFWDKIDSDQEEMQNLHDSIEEHKTATLEAQQQQYEILHDIEENQLSLENKVLQAIEESRQREIDELQKERDAFAEASDKIIDGLADQLAKERDMYDRSTDSEELIKLQRQLQILQRSGGSADQIMNLQREISQKQQDAYFDAQQAQIDALQESSDNQLAKMDQQIDLMTKQLEFEKLHGMLWGQVYEQMMKSPAEIAQCIQDNTQRYWGESPLELTKTIREDLFQATQYNAMIDSVGSIQDLVQSYTDEMLEQKRAEEKKKAEEQQKADEAARKKKEEEAKKKTTKTTSSPPASSGGSQAVTSRDEYISNNQYTHAHYKVYSDGRREKVGDEPHNIINSAGVCAQCEVAIPGRARAMGNAFAKGKSLLGELGPEAWVSNGQFHISGQTGAEMVNLPNDAIVFNHQQTANLLKTGHTYSRGKVRNEDKAIGNDQRENAIKAFWDKVEAHRAETIEAHSSRIGQKLTIQDLYAQNQSIINQNTGTSPIVIENASVNMQVAKIADDYDARRAGEQALSEMMRIARKTGVTNSIRR